MTIHTTMGIKWTRNHDPRSGWIKFQYKRFFTGKEVDTYHVYCKNLADFLSLLYYWKCDDWHYLPAVDKYGYILKGE